MYFALMLLANGAPAPGEGPSALSSLAPFLIVGVLAWLFLFRPMQRQEKQRQAMVAALKRNDKIVNSGGVIGIVESIKEKEDEVVLKGGLRITRSSITRVVGPEESKDKDQ